MKSYNHLFEKVLEEDNRRLAIKNASRGKSKRKLKYFTNDVEKTVGKSYNWIVNFRNSSHNVVIIYDGVGRKKRKIIVPTFEELTVQHAVVNAMKPMFLKGMYEHSYASIPGRGVHLGKKHIEKWIRKDKKNVKYVLKMDIKHFFDSVPHDILKEKLKKAVHDERLLDLLFKIIDVTDIGLPLGFYTSQWLSNWYLQELDHYIKEQLKAVHYMRYMDDMVIFASNKKVLHKMRQDIDRFLQERLGLQLKENWQVFRFDYIKKGKHYGRHLDFMGFRFYRDRTTLRRTIMLKATRKAKKISKKERATIHDIQQMLSYVGWIDCTDTYQMYVKWIKPYVNFQQFKRRLSRYSKRMNRQKEGNYERCVQAQRRFSECPACAG